MGMDGWMGWGGWQFLCEGSDSAMTMTTIECNRCLRGALLPAVSTSIVVRRSPRSLREKRERAWFGRSESPARARVAPASRYGHYYNSRYTLKLRILVHHKFL